MTTQAQRDAYRNALEDAGVPEVLAYMAAANMNEVFLLNRSASSLVNRGFCWEDSPEGFDFWYAVFLNAGGDWS